MKTQNHYVVIPVKLGFAILNTSSGHYLDHDTVERDTNPEYSGVWATEVGAYKFILEEVLKSN